MSFIAEYFTKQRECIEKYGERTVLIIQKGIFYEIYEYNPDYDTSGKTKGDTSGKDDTSEKKNNFENH